MHRSFWNKVTALVSHKVVLARDPLITLKWLPNDLGTPHSPESAAFHNQVEQRINDLGRPDF